MEQSPGSLSSQILENAIDSLIEAHTELLRVERENGLERRYKFIVIWVYLFVELYLKSFIASKNDLLIYRKPWKAIRSTSATISLEETGVLLKNLGFELPSEVLADIKRLKKIRNAIMHHSWESSNLDQVQNLIPATLKHICAYDEQYSYCDLLNMVAAAHPDTYADFLERVDRYQDKKEQAILEVDRRLEAMKQQLSQKELAEGAWRDDLKARECPECGHDTVVACPESDTGYRCQFCQQRVDPTTNCCMFCGEEFPGDEIEDGRCSYCDHILSKD